MKISIVGTFFVMIVKHARGTSALHHMHMLIRPFLCCTGGNGLQVRLVGRFKNKNDSHLIISRLFGYSIHSHVTSLYSGNSEFSKKSS